MRGNREQVRAVASGRDAAREFQVRFVDERCRMNCPHAFFARVLPARESSEVIVQDRKDAIQRGAITRCRRLKQPRDVAELGQVGNWACVFWLLR
jgi:hypothetical protein